MSTTAMRKHLEVLEKYGYAASHEVAPFGPTDSSPRGRGRPAAVFAITTSGREFFEQTYDDVAVSAIRFIQQRYGTDAVRAFAAQRAEAVLAAVTQGAIVSTEQLATGLAEQGYSSSLRPAPVGDAVQLCQHNCPISHVAREFPEFCEAETEAIGKALDVHVTRISTIAGGSAVCTTHIPLHQPQPRRSA
jgi:predicted ArsR family transcriptional regulator